MKTCTRFFVLFIVGLLAIPIMMASSSSRSKILDERKLAREITAVESQLRKAIAKKDTKALELLLADYYADSLEGSDHAVGKQATLAKCKAGTLTYFGISEQKKLTPRGDITQIEGVSRVKLESGHDKYSEVHVMRLWSRESGRWKLISQTVGHSDQDEH